MLSSERGKFVTNSYLQVSSSDVTFNIVIKEMDPAL